MFYILRLLAIGALVLTPVVMLSSCGGGGGGSSDASTDTGTGGGTAAVTYNGTVFADIGGSAPAPGVIVEINETGGNQILLTTDANGNFSTTQGNPSGGYTSTIQGNTIPMVAAQVNGTCSASACHDTVTQAVVYTN